MFTKEALEHLENKLTVQNIAQVAGMAVVPNNHELVSTEEFQEFRNRYRGELKTDSFGGFAAYINKFKLIAMDYEEGVQLFVDKKSMSAKVFFNLGSYESPETL